MKRNLIRFSLLIVLLAAAPQMISTATPVGQNTNSSTMAPQPAPMPMNPCRRRCLISYRKCLRWAHTPAQRRACAMRYRMCLRHCTMRR
jgi:hypothetical protein